MKRCRKGDILEETLNVMSQAVRQGERERGIGYDDVGLDWIRFQAGRPYLDTR